MTSIQIRPYCLDDAQPVVDAVLESLAQMQPWMPWCHPTYSVIDSRSWLEAQVPAFAAGTAFEFAIESADGKFLGGCGLNQIDTINRRANLGYWVRSSATGQGVATGAVRALRDWAFAVTDLVRLEIVVAVGNAASHRVAEKVGAVREGTLIRRLVFHGALRDATMFALTRDLPVAAPAGERGV
jgi:ribosomal-protein-serine acetyltransferase